MSALCYRGKKIFAEHFSLGVPWTSFRKEFLPIALIKPHLATSQRTRLPIGFVQMRWKFVFQSAGIIEYFHCILPCPDYRVSPTALLSSNRGVLPLQQMGENGS